jgi:FkbM family methyltransferase
MYIEKSKIFFEIRIPLIDMTLFLKSLLPPKIIKFIGCIKKKIVAKGNIKIIFYHCSKQWYGNDYGGFYICPDLLCPPPPHHTSSDSCGKKIIVYSCGIGEDISFDIAIMKEYDCDVFAFDPTPKSIAWIKMQNLPGNFVFAPYGISGKTKGQSLYLSNTPLDISASVYVHDYTAADDCVTVQMKSLADIAAEYHHDYIDILKMDIEGSEFDVIRNLPQNIVFGQIVVEFHERFLNNGKKILKEMFKILKKKGYNCFAVSEHGDEYSFINKNEYRRRKIKCFRKRRN